MANLEVQRLRARQDPSNQFVFVQDESERRPFVQLSSHKPSHTNTGDAHRREGPAGGLAHMSVLTYTLLRGAGRQTARVAAW